MGENLREKEDKTIVFVETKGVMSLSGQMGGEWPVLSIHEMKRLEF